jgi:hypothetical protein
MRAICLIAALLCVGCHGSQLWLGGGKLFQDQSASIAGGCGSRGNIDVDDSYFAGAAVGIQLTPESVVHLDPAPSPIASERLYPYEEPEPEPNVELVALRAAVEDLSDKLAVLSADIVSVSERVTRIEARGEDAITKADLLRLAGGGGAAGLLGWGGVHAYRRRREGSA